MDDTPSESKLPDHVYLVWDLKTYRILCICMHANSARALIANDPEAAFGIMASDKPIVHDSKNLAGALTRMPPQKITDYKFHIRGFFLVLRPTGTDFLDKDLTQRSELMIQKSRCLDRVNYLVSRTRQRVVPSEIGWEAVHSIRYNEAKAHRREKREGAEEANPHLFLRQYAQVRGLDLDRAADQIIFEYELVTMGLFQTEEVLLKYMDLIPKTKNKEEIALLMREFSREFYLNARI